MSAIDCVVVLNELARTIDGGEGEMQLDFVHGEVLLPNDAAVDKSEEKADECFAHWDELLPLLLAPPQSQSDFLQAWEQEDLRRKLELESVLADSTQDDEEEVRSKSLHTKLI